MPEIYEINKYLISLENPDSIGWDEKNKRWNSPTLPGYDKNQRGIGLDIVKNKELASYLKKHPRPGNYLTKEEEEFFRNKHLQYLNDVFEKNTQQIKKSESKKIMALGLMYHGHGPSLWSDKNDGLYHAFHFGSDEDFKNAISAFYQTRNPERMKNHENYWKTHAQKQNVIPQRIKRNVEWGTHVEQPDVLKVARPVWVGRYINGGKLLPWRSVPFSMERWNQILNAIRTFKFNK